MSFIERLKSFFGAPASNGGSGDEPMISCERALSVVNEYLDGELEGLTPAQVRAHFEACERCYPYLRLEEAFREALRRASCEEAAPPEVRRKLLDALAEAEG